MLGILAGVVILKMGLNLYSMEMEVLIWPHFNLCERRQVLKPYFYPDQM